VGRRIEVVRNDVTGWSEGGGGRGAERPERRNLVASRIIEVFLNCTDIIAGKKVWASVHDAGDRVLSGYGRRRRSPVMMW